MDQPQLPVKMAEPWPSTQLTNGLLAHESHNLIHATWRGHGSREFCALWPIPGGVAYGSRPFHCPFVVSKESTPC